MDKILELINDFCYTSVALRLLLAAVFGGLIGSERGRHGRAAGMRTHILICIGAAMTSLTGLFIAHIGSTGDISRISAQVISGIGFLGVGTIMVRNNSIVTGLTTAAGMWATAAIGIAVGYGFYTAALLATAICIFTVTVLSRLEKNRKNVIHLYVEICDTKSTGMIVDTVRAMENAVSVDLTQPKSNCNGHIGLLVDVRVECGAEDSKSKISAIEGVDFVVEEMS